MTCLECVAHPKKLCRVHGMTSNHDIDDDEQLRIRELETDLALMAEENTKLRACVEAAYIPFSVREATQSPVAYLAKPKAYLQKIQEGYANAHRAFIEKQAARIAELEGALGEAQEHLYSCVPATGWGLRDQGADADRKEVLAKLNAALAIVKGEEHSIPSHHARRHAPSRDCWCKPSMEFNTGRWIHGEGESK